VAKEIILNKNQRQAVKYNQGPLLIIAGAGTGKTTVITEKIKHIILSKLAKAEEILALTFTEKAAYEMEERVDKALPYGYFQTWIATFHSFADQVLKDEGLAIGLPIDYKILSDAESILFFRRHLFEFNFKYYRPTGNPNKFIHALINHFSRLRDEDVDPQEYRQWVKEISHLKKIDQIEKDKYLELVNGYSQFQALKAKAGFLDFSDLIFYLVKLFRKRPNILKKYRKKFKFILVDEFQDTNLSQYRLIKLLAPPQAKPRLTVVGDDSQSIYKFRGASVSNILNFIKDYKKAKQITLIDNYRSNQEILDYSYRLIKNNDPDTLEARLGISKQLRSARGKGRSKSLKLIITTKVEDEAEEVVQQILRLKKEKKYQYSEIAILTRAHNHSQPFIRALGRRGVPYQFIGPGILFKQPEIKDLIAFLKVIADPNQSVALFRLLSMDIFKINGEDLVLLNSFAKKINRSLFETIIIYLSFYYPEFQKEKFDIYDPYRPLLFKETKEKLKKIFLLIKKYLRLVNYETGGQILYYFLENSGLLKKISEYQTEREEKKALNISKFFSRIKEYESKTEDSSIFALRDWLELAMEIGDSPMATNDNLITVDAVNILTSHSAKGLEFPVVFIVNLVNGRFPTRKRKETIPLAESLVKEILPQGDFHLQEERRLFYVSMTRAQEKLYLTLSKYYGQGKRIQKISPFIKEMMPEKEILKRESLLLAKEKQPSFLSYQKISKEIKITKKLTLTTFSYSQINTYQICPRQYRYQYILKIPTETAAASSLGTVIHKTLNLFYKKYLREKRLPLHQLLAMYKENWLSIGYNSALHEEKMKEEGKIMLTNYYHTFHPPQLKIIDLERPFKIKINQNIYLKGQIDRVDFDEKNQSVEIIDYKTGKIPSAKDIKKNLQLAIYTLAIRNRQFYRQSFSQIKSTFYFLKANKKISQIINQKQIAKAKETLSRLIDKINQGDFAPNPGPWCDFCPFKIICNL